MIVMTIRRKIIRTVLCCIVCHSCIHKRTHMSSSSCRLLGPAGLDLDMLFVSFLPSASVVYFMFMVNFLLFVLSFQCQCK